MRVKILKRSFAGAEFAPDVRVLKVGGQSSAGVEKLEFVETLLSGQYDRCNAITVPQ